MSRARLTAEGWGALALTFGVGLVALRLAEPLAIVLFACLVAAWLQGLWVGWRNLRGVSVTRQLPTELFVNAEARGALRLQATGGRGRAVRVEELGLADAGGEADDAGGAEGRLVPVGWTFPARGRVSLGDVVLSSVWPFGWVVFSRRVELPAVLVVYPRPAGGELTHELGVGEGEEGATRALGAFGDFAGLRAYQAGDPVRAIHWPTTARVGQLVVAQREGEGEPVVWVQVVDRRGLAWERELSLAAGHVLRAGRIGARVGLEMAGERYPPQAGLAWRRELLELLALAPERP